MAEENENTLLGRPLVFGDKEQVAELRRLGYYKPAGDVPLKKYEVEITFSGTHTVVVEAPSAEDAEDIAVEAGFEACDADIETDRVEATELPEKSDKKVDIPWED
jgi:hypothetical protein